MLDDTRVERPLCQRLVALVPVNHNVNGEAIGGLPQRRLQALEVAFWEDEALGAASVVGHLDRLRLGVEAAVQGDAAGDEEERDDGRRPEEQHPRDHVVEGVRDGLRRRRGHLLALSVVEAEMAAATAPAEVDPDKEEARDEDAVGHDNGPDVARHVLVVPPPEQLRVEEPEIQPVLPRLGGLPLHLPDALLEARVPVPREDNVVLDQRHVPGAALPAGLKDDRVVNVDRLAARDAPALFPHVVENLAVRVDGLVDAFLALLARVVDNDVVGQQAQPRLAVGDVGARVLVGQQHDDVQPTALGGRQVVGQGGEGMLQGLRGAADAGDADAEELVVVVVLGVGVDGGEDEALVRAGVEDLLEVLGGLLLADGRVGFAKGALGAVEDGGRVVEGVEEAPEQGAQPDEPKGAVGPRQPHLSDSFLPFFFFSSVISPLSTTHRRCVVAFESSKSNHRVLRVLVKLSSS